VWPLSAGPETRRLRAALSGAVPRRATVPVLASARRPVIRRAAPRLAPDPRRAHRVLSIQIVVRPSAAAPGTVGRLAVRPRLGLLLRMRPMGVFAARRALAPPGTVRLSAVQPALVRPAPGLLAWPRPVPGRLALWLPATRHPRRICLVAVVRGMVARPATHPLPPRPCTTHPLPVRPCTTPPLPARLCTVRRSPTRCSRTRPDTAHRTMPPSAPAGTSASLPATV
jgi:hypothetical protein